MTSTPGPTHHSIQVVRDMAGARLLLDPMRREILRILGPKPLTGSHLSKTLGLSPASVSYHLRALERGGFITMVRAEAGNHGITQKLYKPNADVFLVDKTNLPIHMRHCFMPAEVERVRGLMASLTPSKDAPFDYSTGLLERVCESFSDALLDVAQVQPVYMDDDPERVINHLYREAFRSLLNSDAGIFHGLSAAT